MDASAVFQAYDEVGKKFVEKQTANFELTKNERISDTTATQPFLPYSYPKLVFSVAIPLSKTIRDRK